MLVRGIERVAHAAPVVRVPARNIVGEAIGAGVCWMGGYHCVGRVAHADTFGMYARFWGDHGLAAKADRVYRNNLLAAGVFGVGFAGFYISFVGQVIAAKEKRAAEKKEQLKSDGA